MGRNLVTHSTLRDRLELADLCNTLGLLGHAAEVGVWLGHYSVPFLQRWRGQHLHLIDPWRKLPSDEYQDVRNDDFDPEDYDRAVAAFAPFGDRAVIHRATSQEAAAQLPHEFDFVYIDANHARAHVAADMRAWWGKLSPCAILAGHDFYIPDHLGVTDAVIEFCLEYGVTAQFIPGDHRGSRLVNYHSWMIMKGIT